jgi:hypothetical protein
MKMPVRNIRFNRNLRENIGFNGLDAGCGNCAAGREADFQEFTATGRP